MTLKNLSLSTRLALSFAFIVLITLIIGSISLSSLSSLNKAADMNDRTFRMLAASDRMQLDTVTIETGARGYLLSGAKDHLEPFRNGQAAFEKDFAEAKQLTADNPKQQERLERLRHFYIQFIDSQKRLMSIRDQSGDLSQIYSAFSDSRDMAMRDIRALIIAIAGEERSMLAKRSETLTTVRAQNKWAVLLGNLLVIVAAIGMAILIRRQLLKRLGSAIGVADAISRGKLDNAIDLRSKDEAGALLLSMDKMQSQLQAVLAAQAEMAQRHDAGQIGYRMDEGAFPGDYGRMVSDTNALASSQVAVTLRLAHIMGRYAIGDLSEDMERLPGEKAQFTQTMDTVKQNLTAMNHEIQHLAGAAAAGNFGVRGDTERFQYEFRAMVERLNELMATADGNLQSLSSLLRSIAAGDLTARMHGDFQGVFATMRDDANTTAEQLTTIVGGIQNAATSINAAASEIASGNDDLARRTEQQAASLEETAASMEELTSTVKQNAEHARQANQLAGGAATVASQGGSVVGKVVETMSGIEASSKKIADIISVIDGIAFQTNILALNAAVEAARAGEQGRGFAVVASEVRTLAQRSANAAKEIKDLIADSVSRVTEGSVLVDQAGKTMQEIVSSVQRVTDIMGEISAASQEQSSGIEQVNHTITQMDEVTQQNAALVEEATAAARSMEEQAGQLSQAVAVFKIDAGSAAHGQSAATVAPARPVARPAAKATVKRATHTARQPTRPLAVAAGNDSWQEF
ncbi:methyl-accepting chemotaxis protein [Xanthomonas sacchari]|uniref:methyl-accepting chemotaxis protein n=1 Tax=Xanthomonas sacchari TaxID=56458 RepID=UPI0020C2CA97|nr:methyl-accepting chemotaxis protein [Xanthomonas sacchari]